jgi:hypothetical protein
MGLHNGGVLSEMHAELVPIILLVQVFQNGGSSSQVHEEAEDVDEREGDE